ncbi:glycoside hydrolase family 3 protein, partial [Pectobacterium versatile]|nr:glycoside hydrolase family 3 protein [Pectobacterium versatile]
DETSGKLIMDNHVGGVILFANNLKDQQQIKTLTAWYAAMKTRADIRLFIGTDNEGGNVFRLPRGDYAS